MPKNQSNVPAPPPPGNLQLPVTPSLLRAPSSNARQSSRSSSSVQFSQASPPAVTRTSNTTNSVATTPRRPSSTTAVKKKMRVDVAAPSMERNFVTLERAMADFLLTQDDLDGLRRTTRRSPYATPPEIVVLSRTEVIQRNCGCLVLKLVAWYYTKSHSMFSEFLHSVADTANQVILAVGVYTSTKQPNVIYPYGFTNMKFVSALISGVGIFCVGTGLSLYHGVVGLVEPSAVVDYFWAVMVMVISGVLELTTLLMAVRSLRLEAKSRSMSAMAFLVTSQDPGVNVVLTEDLAAVVSLLVASGCLLLSHHTGSPVPDAVGSLLVGVVLGAVAVFIISTNAGRLVGRSIPAEELQQINAELEGDVMVRAIHDVKGIDMGNNMVRYKAELDFDGRQLARAYLDQVNMALLQESVKGIRTLEELEEFMLDHGENLVDMIGGQIDRIERKLKVSHPSIRHCDLEIL